MFKYTRIALLSLFYYQICVSCNLNQSRELVWAEEFNYNGLPNSEVWDFDTAGNSWGWGNNELQYYTNEDLNNIWVDNGYLSIAAKKKSIDGKHYTSARLTTKNKKVFKHGRLEVRAKLPHGRGVWPAIWMLGQNIDEVGWPMCGEIDIMEYVGYQPDSIFATIHSESYNHMKNTQKMKSTYFTNPNDFNIYTIEWSDHKIDFYFNEVLYNRIINERKSDKEWPFSKPFYLLLNVAVGGNWGGKYGVDDNLFPAIMEIDYVRYYN